MARDYARLRITSPDGLVASSTVRAVAPDGTETPLEDVVTRCELTCDPETGLWKAVLWVEEVEVDIVVGDVEARDVAMRPATEEN